MRGTSFWAGAGLRVGDARNILVVAGESSADRYAGQLVESIRRLRGSERVRFYGTGGDRMQAAGVHLVAHLRDLGHIGPREAIAHLARYYEAYRRILQATKECRPDIAILLDFPDFNLRLAKKMKRAGVAVIYYIGPQVWAWRRGRIRIIQRYVDKMLVILPFEEEFYRKHGVKVEFVGHPLLEDFAPVRDRDAFLRRLDLDPRSGTIALLPGSRRTEVEHILPVLLQSAVRMLRTKPLQFVISKAPAIQTEQILGIIETHVPADARALFRVSTEESRDIMANSDFALVKSGTSTLEAALVETPFLMVYKISPASWCVGRFLIRSRFKGLVNLIAGEQVVPEFLQGDATPEALSNATLEYLNCETKTSGMRSQLAGIRTRLSARCASQAAAAAVDSFLRNGKYL
jgi:lipid-A-disaccharide synthase